MKQLRLATVFALLGLVSAGCSVNPATGERSFTGLMSPEQELRVGKQEHPKILQQFGGAYDHATISRYVDDLGQRLARVSELPILKWTFTVLDDPIINAFALPGGYIYISRGLITLAENEAELAAVLGHEIGHVTARHTAQRYSQSVLTGIGATVLGIVVGGPAGDIANFAGQAYIAGYSRGQELEADKLGIRYMTKLGYDPNASASFFKKLAEHTELQAKMKGQKGQQGHYSIFASHPDTQKRIVASNKIAAKYPADLNLQNRDTYLALIDGLDYGESIKQGFVDGQTFFHPPLRFAFSAPDGFVFENRPSYVAAVHNNGSAMVFQMTRNKHGALPMTRYLSEVWASKYSLRDIQPLQVNGLEAATGVVRLNTKKGVRDIRYLVMADGDEIFMLRFLSPPKLTQQMELPFRRATYSFKRLSRQEAQSMRGYRIGLHRAHNHDTLASLAERMRVHKYQEDWLKVLNKEALKDGLQAGETLKIIEK